MLREGIAVMRFYEFASADDKLELWRVIDRNVWTALNAEGNPAKSKSKVVTPKKPKAPTKAEFKRRGTQIAAANSQDDIDPNAHAAERLQQAQQQQIPRQQALLKHDANSAIKSVNINAHTQQ
jgi:hypothetical protein